MTQTEHGVGLRGPAADPVQDLVGHPDRRVMDHAGAVEVLLLGPVDLAPVGLLDLGRRQRRGDATRPVEHDHGELGASDELLDQHLGRPGGEGLVDGDGDGPDVRTNDVDPERRPTRPRLDGDQPLPRPVLRGQVGPERCHGGGHRGASGVPLVAVHAQVRGNREPGLGQRLVTRLLVQRPGQCLGCPEHVGDAPCVEPALELAVLAEPSVDEWHGHVVGPRQRSDPVPVQPEVQRLQLGLEVGARVGVVEDGWQDVRPELAIDEDDRHLAVRVGLQVRHPGFDGAGAHVALLARPAEEEQHLHRAVTSRSAGGRPDGPVPPTGWP